MPESETIATIRPRRPQPVFACRKCLKRMDDGKSLRKALKTALKERSAALGIRRPRLVLTDCFGICPKRSVVVTNGNALNRGEYLLMTDRKSAAMAAEILVPQEP